MTIAYRLLYLITDLLCAFVCVQLAAQAVLTEVSGKAAAYVSGVLSVKRKAFVLEAPSQVAVNQVSAGSQQYGAAEATSKASGKRKAGASNSTMSPSGLAINGGSSQRVEYRDKSAILLGQVDEDKLERQVKAVRSFASTIPITLRIMQKVTRILT